MCACAHTCVHTCVHTCMYVCMCVVCVHTARACVCRHAHVCRDHGPCAPVCSHAHGHTRPEHKGRGRKRWEVADGSSQGRRSRREAGFTSIPSPGGKFQVSPLVTGGRKHSAHLCRACAERRAQGMTRGQTARRGRLLAPGRRQQHQLRAGVVWLGQVPFHSRVHTPFVWREAGRHHGARTVNTQFCGSVAERAPRGMGPVGSHCIVHQPAWSQKAGASWVPSIQGL